MSQRGDQSLQANSLEEQLRNERVRQHEQHFQEWMQTATRFFVLANAGGAVATLSFLGTSMADGGNLLACGRLISDGGEPRGPGAVSQLVLRSEIRHRSKSYNGKGLAIAQTTYPFPLWVTNGSPAWVGPRLEGHLSRFSAITAADSAPSDRHRP